MGIIVFETKITDKDCKHTWEKLKTEGQAHGVFQSVKISFEYLHCPKCGSNSGDTVKI